MIEKHYAGSDPDSLCYRKSKNNIYELSFLIVCFSYPRSFEGNREISHV